MPTEVILPKVDMDMETGTISAWHVSDGDVVSQGDPLFDIETDKATMEVESPASGTLHHIVASEGDTLPIGRTVAWIFAEGEAVPDGPPTSAPIEVEAEQSDVALTDEAPQPMTHVAQPDGTAQKTRATPAARKLARDSGLALSDIPGTGPRARIQSSDVQGFLQTDPQPNAAPAQITWDPSGAPLNIVRSGKGDATPCFLIHGLGADANAWALVEKTLAAKGPVLRIELPCHGKSPAPKHE